MVAKRNFRRITGLALVAGSLLAAPAPASAAPSDAVQPVVDALPHLSVPPVQPGIVPPPLPVPVPFPPPSPSLFIP